MLRMVLCAVLVGCAGAPKVADVDVSDLAGRTRPRLWVTVADVPALRARTDTSLFRDGLLPLANDLRTEMDGGSLDNEDCVDTGTIACESYALLFAFMSLVHTDGSEREDFARRARTILLRVLKEASKGPKEGVPLREPAFSVDNRSRWSGESFALVVDWIYPKLSADDKALVRKVFLRWSKEQLSAKVTTKNHPVPVGLLRDPRLTADRSRVRWAGNNYYAAHARNLALMALALEPEDDPGEELRAYLDNATGAWLYVIDNLLATDAAGGLGAEGLQYQAQSMGYVAQTLWALKTAGVSLERYGTYLKMGRFWDDAIVAHYHLHSPRRIARDWKGPQHELAWYGDGQSLEGLDFIDLMAPIGLAGGTERLERTRWMQLHMPPGGADGILRRMRKTSSPREAILYFMLAPDQARERPTLPLSHHAEGLGHLYARTSWNEDATWFRYILGWIAVDHQHAEGNHFGWYRKGEWLTKKRVGYSYTNLSSTQFHNAVTVQNDKPVHNDGGDYRAILWRRGSQWTLDLAEGDGEITRHEITDAHLYVSGDATKLYNSDYEKSQGIHHVSRSLVWLKPDLVVVYDRVETKKFRDRRFWLQLPRVAKVNGKVARMRTPGGQQLFVTSLLPERASIVSNAAERLEDEVANHETMVAQLAINGGEGESDRFLTVLEAADAGESRTKPETIEADGMAGVAIGGIAVLFPRKLDAAPPRFSYRSSAARHLITGLEPAVGYTATRRGNRVEIRRGGPLKASPAGVLRL